MVRKDTLAIVQLLLHSLQQLKICHSQQTEKLGGDASAGSLTVGSSFSGFAL